MLLFVLSCTNRKAHQTTTSKRHYEEPYHYKNTPKSSLSTDYVNKKEPPNNIKINSKKEVVRDTILSDHTTGTEKKKLKEKKKIHLPSIGSVITETSSFGTYYYIQQSIASGIIESLIISLVGFLIVMLSLSIAYLAYLHFLKKKSKYWGSGFSIFSLYSTTLAYIAIAIVGSTILSFIGVPILLLVILTSLLTIPYTYFFFKFIKSIKE